MSPAKKQSREYDTINGVLDLISESTYDLSFSQES